MTASPRGALSRFVAADGFFMSAGLAFFFLMCLIPLLLLGVSMVGFVLSTQEAARHVVGQLAQQFPVYQAQITRVLLRIVETRTASGLLGTAALVLKLGPHVLRADAKVRGSDGTSPAAFPDKRGASRVLYFEGKGNPSGERNGFAVIDHGVVAWNDELAREAAQMKPGARWRSCGPRPLRRSNPCGR